MFFYLFINFFYSLTKITTLLNWNNDLLKYYLPSSVSVTVCKSGRYQFTRKSACLSIVSPETSKLFLHFIYVTFDTLLTFIFILSTLSILKRCQSSMQNWKIQRQKKFEKKTAAKWYYFLCELINLNGNSDLIITAEFSFVVRVILFQAHGIRRVSWT